MANGATYLSPEAYNATRPQQGSLVGIFDVGENELILSRAANGDLREIKSPGGGWIRLAYDKNGRVIRADSSTAEFVEYGYDLDDNLTQVKYSNGEITEYTYDSSNRIAGVRDAAKSVSLQATYGNVGTDGAVNINTVGRFGFSRTVDEKARSVDVEISDPQRQKIRVRIQVINDSLQYTVKGPRGPGVHN